MKLSVLRLAAVNSIVVQKSRTTVSLFEKLVL
jgi:hypothetical protein